MAGFPAFAGSSGYTAYPAANQILNQRFTLDGPAVALSARLPIGVASGNVEIAVRRLGRTDPVNDVFNVVELCTTGIVPAVAGGAPIPFSTNPTLPPGDYVASVWADNTTLTVSRAVQNVQAAAGQALASPVAVTSGIPKYEVLTGNSNQLCMVTVEFGPVLPLWALMGDSITQGQGWFTQSVYDLNWPVRFFNRGISGESTTQMRSRYTAQVTARHPSVLVLLGGRNDVIGGNTSATTISNLESMVTEAVADGSHVLLCTLIPTVQSGGAPLTAGQLTKWNEINTWIRSQSGPNTTVVDWTDEMSTGDGITPQASLFSDNIHPNDAGAGVMAEVVRPIIAARLA
jgi:lysophospholipase L1-like esterase